MQRTYLFLTWSRRVELAYLDAKIGQTFTLIRGIPLLLALAIVLRDDTFADWLGGWLIKAFVADDKRIIGWDVTPFEPFMVKLYALWRGISVAGAKAKTAGCDVYNAIMQQWQNSDAFPELLANACDYHLGRISPEEENDYPEFEFVPYCWFPVEILAIKRIREEQGLSTPLPDHPLMQTAMGNVPRNLPRAKDELLDSVIAKVRSELPIGDPW
jgi:hypothetical protein